MPSRPPSLWRRGLSIFIVVPRPNVVPIAMKDFDGGAGHVDVVVVGPVEFEVAAGEVGEDLATASGR